jgi:hypothetical protein
LLGLLIDHEEGSNMFLRNFGWLSTDYTALHPRRLKYSAVTIVKYVKKNPLRRRFFARRQTHGGLHCSETCSQPIQKALELKVEIGIF